MSTPPPPLSLKILHPCTRSWDSLEGDHRRRYCDDCNLHVWNASELTEQEARDLVASPGRVCMGGMAKSDGLLLTRERLREEARVHLRHRPLLRIAAALGLISIPTALAACTPGIVQQRTGGDVSDRPNPAQQNADLPRPQAPGSPAPLPAYPGILHKPEAPPAAAP